MESRDGEAGKEAFLGMNRRSTMMVKFATQKTTLIVLPHEWFVEDTGHELGKI